MLTNINQSMMAANYTPEESVTQEKQITILIHGETH